MKKQIKCPICEKRLVDSNEKIESLIIKPEKLREEDVDYFVKCRNCKKEIGIRKLL